MRKPLNDVLLRLSWLLCGELTEQEVGRWDRREWKQGSQLGGFEVRCRKDSRDGSGGDQK